LIQPIFLTCWRKSSLLPLFSFVQWWLFFVSWRFAVLRDVFFYTALKMQSFVYTVDELLTCSVCLDRFCTPKVLPCQHTFCMDPCISGIVKQLWLHEVVLSKFKFFFSFLIQFL
jgi:hypothetical protein